MPVYIRNIRVLAMRLNSNFVYSCLVLFSGLGYDLRLLLFVWNVVTVPILDLLNLNASLVILYLFGNVKLPLLLGCTPSKELSGVIFL